MRIFSILVLLVVCFCVASLKKECALPYENKILEVDLITKKYIPSQMDIDSIHHVIRATKNRIDSAIRVLEKETYSVIRQSVDKCYANPMIPSCMDEFGHDTYFLIKERSGIQGRILFACHVYDTGYYIANSGKIECIGNKGENNCYTIIFNYKISHEIKAWVKNLQDCIN